MVTEAGLYIESNDQRKDDAIVFTADWLLRAYTTQTPPALGPFVFGYLLSVWVRWGWSEGPVLWTAAQA